MDREEKLRALIPRLEKLAATNPWRYRAAVLALALAGYAFLGMSVIVLLAATIGVAAVGILSKNPLLIKALLKFFWVPLVIAGAIMKALWVRIQPPEGRRVTRRDAPALIDEVERIRLAVRAPRVHHVVLSQDFNAAAASVPLLGVFGWNRRYLVLGMPLMLALDRERLAAVIAHEFGHHRGQDTRFAGWIYRVRRTWWQLLEGLARDGRGGFLRRFFDWYAPYFDAYSFVLARQNEYEADAAAASVVGAPTAASALVTVDVAAQHLDAAYWPALFKRAANEPAPPAAMYRGLGQSVATIDDTTRARYLEQASRRATDYGDTHPSLGDRLRALGQPVSDAAPPAISSAQALLGELFDTVMREFDTRWRNGVDATWREHFAKSEQERERLAFLRIRKTEHELTIDERFEFAELIESHAPEEDAIEHYHAVLAWAPNHAQTHFALGRLAMASDIALATTHFDAAIAASPDAAEPAYRLLIEHHHSVGDVAQRDAAMTKLKAVFAEYAAAEAERSEVGAKDQFIPHGLDDVTLAAYRQSLATISAIKQAWLVRKIVETRPDRPHFVLLVRVAGNADDSVLQRAVNIDSLPGTVTVINASAYAKIVSRAIERVAGESLLTKRGF